jgi:HSP20 family molecular chaperone IbpA
MLKKILITTLIAGATLFAATDYIPNLNAEIKGNKHIIKEYEKRIKQLKERNKFLASTKKKNPKLYEEKTPFEETKQAYLQRIKLNGAKAKDINFKIQNHIASIEMRIKKIHKDKNAYSEISRSFYQDYSIPKNVEESKISHYVDGDYFVIKMPKK